MKVRKLETTQTYEVSLEELTERLGLIGKIKDIDTLNWDKEGNQIAKIRVTINDTLDN